MSAVTDAQLLEAFGLTEFPPSSDMARAIWNRGDQTLLIENKTRPSYVAKVDILSKDLDNSCKLLTKLVTYDSRGRTTPIWSLQTDIVTVLPFEQIKSIFASRTFTATAYNEDLASHKEIPWIVAAYLGVVDYK